MTILVVDQDFQVLESIRQAFDQEQFILKLCDNFDTAREALWHQRVDLIISELCVGKETSLPLLNEARQTNQDMVIMLMTSTQPTLQTAVEVLKLNIFDFVLKPFAPEDLKLAVQRGIEEVRKRRENVYLKCLVSLHQVAETVATTNDLNLLLGLILDTAVKEFQADLSTVLLWDEGENRFRMAGYRSKNELTGRIPKFFTAGPNVIYLKPQIVSIPEEIDRVLPMVNKDRIISLITYPLFAQARIIGILYLARYDGRQHFSSEDIHSLSILASKAAAAVENSRLYLQLEQAYLSTINALANAVEARDTYTRGHTDRVWYLAETLAKKMGWEGEKLRHVRMGSILHDIGKLGVPDSILNKPSPLTDDEFQIMKKHPEMGAKILEGINFLDPALPYVLYHHERYDGKGYPAGLSGEDIPQEGRLMAVVDTFDAITSDRPYRKSRGFKKAIEELIRCSGSQFDPEIAQVLIEAWEQGIVDKKRLDVKFTQAHPKLLKVPSLL